MLGGAALVEANLSNSEFGVTQICTEMGFSRIQLYRKVKALMGIGVGDYISTVRLRKAALLIRETSDSMTKIAYQVGYSTPAYFSTAFKNQFGVSPSDYRERKFQRR